MKKNALLGIMLLLVCTVFAAPNLQLHYDFGSSETEREYFTSTITDFTMDEWGGWFWMVDLDYNAPFGAKSASNMYLEIERYVKIPWLKDTKLSGLMLHLEYQDGYQWGGGEYEGVPYTYGAGSYCDAYNVGFAYQTYFPTISTVFQQSALIRFDRGSDENPHWQASTAWVTNFLNNKVTFTGCLDIWSQEDFYTADDNEDQMVTILTEPQLWYNLHPHISLGGEVEITKNWSPLSDELIINPTLGIKWNF